MGKVGEWVGMRCLRGRCSFGYVDMGWFFLRGRGGIGGLGEGGWVCREEEGFWFEGERDRVLMSGAGRCGCDSLVVLVVYWVLLVMSIVLSYA